MLIVGEGHPLSNIFWIEEVREIGGHDVTEGRSEDDIVSPKYSSSGFLDSCFDILLVLFIDFRRRKTSDICGYYNTGHMDQDIKYDNNAS